jgi:hypothetical protein
VVHARFTICRQITLFGCAISMSVQNKPDCRLTWTPHMEHTHRKNPIKRHTEETSAIGPLQKTYQVSIVVTTFLILGLHVSGLTKRSYSFSVMKSTRPRLPVRVGERRKEGKKSQPVAGGSQEREKVWTAARERDRRVIYSGILCEICA